MSHLASALILSLAASGSAAASGRLALIVGEVGYASMPALPACAASAGLVARKLQAAGTDVTQLADLSNGALSGSMAAFSAKLAASPASAAVVYVCGYGAALGARDFLLPVTANIGQPADLLSEGVLVRTFLSFAPQSRAVPLTIVFDLVSDPAGVLSPVSGSSAHGALPAGTGVLIASEARPPSAPTVLAGALAAMLTGPALPSAPLSVLAEHLPRGAGISVAGVQDAAAAAPVQAAPDATRAAAPSAPLPSAGSLPDDAALTPTERRRIQVVLASLGYYDGRLDGIFGSDSRAAIRRWQHEIGTDMTGILTSVQATRLAASQR